MAPTLTDRPGAAAIVAPAGRNDAGTVEEALVWRLAMGVHESTMRAAVADLIPIGRRGTGYGVFTAIYGLAWLGGAAAIGALYDASLRDLEIFVVALQAAAIVAFVPLAAGRSAQRS